MGGREYLDIRKAVTMVTTVSAVPAHRTPSRGCTPLPYPSKEKYPARIVTQDQGSSGIVALIVGIAPTREDRHHRHSVLVAGAAHPTGRTAAAYRLDPPRCDRVTACLEWFDYLVQCPSDAVGRLPVLPETLV